MLMRCFRSVNSILQQYNDLLPKNCRNQFVVYYSIVCHCLGFTYADNLNYAVQILLIVAFCGHLC